MDRDRVNKNVESTGAGRGMQGSKNQGGRDFDREKESDKFMKSEEREKKEEGLHASGQATGMGGAKSSQGSKVTGEYYSGSQQEKAEPGIKGSKAKRKSDEDEEHIES